MSGKITRYSETSFGADYDDEEYLYPSDPRPNVYDKVQRQLKRSVSMLNEILEREGFDDTIPAFAPHTVFRVAVVVEGANRAEKRDAHERLMWAIQHVFALAPHQDINLLDVEPYKADLLEDVGLVLCTRITIAPTEHYERVKDAIADALEHIESRRQDTGFSSPYFNGSMEA